MTRSDKLFRSFASLEAEEWRVECDTSKDPAVSDKGAGAAQMYARLDDPDPWLTSRNKREIYLAIAAYYLTLGGYGRLVEVLMLVADNSTDREKSIIMLCKRHNCSYNAAERLYYLHLAELRRIFLFTKRVRAPPVSVPLAA